MRPMIEDSLGEPRPKQYCAFTGSRTMLQHTVDRAMTLVPEDHIVTVICKGQRQFLSENNGNGRKHPGRILEQPINRGTAPAVFFGLSYISQCDPNATVLILPSDHFAFPESNFIHYLENSFQFAERDSGKTLLLLGVHPDGPEYDYGWIESDESKNDSQNNQNGFQVQNVRSLHEKPGFLMASELFLQRCLWNTMIMAGKIETFWRLLEKHLPHTLREFRFLQPGIGRGVGTKRTDRFSRPLFSNNGEGPGVVFNGPLDQPEDGLRTVQIMSPDWCDAVFDGMQAADFSSDILQQETEDLRVLPMEGVNWSDWGRPDRVMASLRKIGASPSLPFQLLEDQRDVIPAQAGIPSP